MKTDGTVLIGSKVSADGVIKGFEVIKSGMNSITDDAKRTASSINASFSRMEFSKPVELAKAKVEALTQRLAAVADEYKLAISGDDDKAASRMGAKYTQIYDQLAAARRRLQIEVAAAANKQAQAEEKEQKKTTATAKREAEKAAQALDKKFSKMERSASRFGTRLRRILSAAFIFNIISRGFRKITDYIGNALKQNEEFNASWENLKKSLATAFQPIYELLLPVLTGLMNVASKIVSAIGEVFALAAGKSYEEIKKNAEALYEQANAADELGKEAEKAKKSLAGFDEITKLQDYSKSASSENAGTSGSGLGDLTQEKEDSSAIEKSWNNIVDKFKEFKYETLGKISVKNLENYRASVLNLESGWKNLMDTFSSGDGTLTDLAASISDAYILARAGENKMLGGLLDFIAESRRYYAKTANKEGADAFDKSIFGAIFGDKGVWDSLGEIGSGWGTLVSAYMPSWGYELLGTTEEEWNNLFLSITEDYENLYKNLSAKSAEALEEYDSVYDQLKNKIRDLKWSDVITQEDLDDVAKYAESVFSTIEKQSDESYEEARRSVQELVEEGLLTEEAEKKSLEELQKTYENQKTLVKNNQNEINKILEKAKNENRALTIEEEEEITSYLEGSYEKQYDIINKGANASTEIYEMIQNNRGKMSKQMLSQAIQYANAEYDVEKQKAEDVYKTTMDNADRLYYELGIIDEEEYKRIKEAAEEQKKVQIKNAEDTREKLIKEAQEAAGGVADAVDPETGEILSNWEIMWNGMYDKVNGTWDDIKTTIKNAINAVIDFCNTPARWLNSLFDKYGGKSWFGQTIPSYHIDELPHLARGAVIPPNKEFLAVLGDQKHGTNIEAPLTTIQEAVALVMEDYAAANIAGHEATVAVLSNILEAVLGIHIGDDVVGQAVSRYNAKMAIIKGGSA